MQTLAPDQFDEHYYSYRRYVKETFGGKTYKVVVSSGLSCPTRDGLIDQGGCAFCDVRGSSSYFGKKGRGAEIKEQIRSRIPGIRERFKAEKFIAYFQSYTNTYSDIGYLREIYEAALGEPEISGLAIGTRPDCIPDPVIDLLEELAQKHYVCLELGVQSFENSSLNWLERGHDDESSRDALRRLHQRAPNVETCVHLMFGSPSDTLESAKNAALEINQLHVRGVKLHQLMILERTKLATLYRTQPFKTLSIEEYTAMVSEFLAHLSPDTYVERLCATATHKEECLAPEWSRNRWEPHNQMRMIMLQNDLRQGQAIGSGFQISGLTSGTSASLAQLPLQSATET